MNISLRSTRLWWRRSNLKTTFSNVYVYLCKQS